MLNPDGEPRGGAERAQSPTTVYAQWSVVPEPSTGLLVGLGLAGLAGKAVDSGSAE